MTESFAETLANRIVQSGIASAAQISGCSEQDISEFESRINRQLPSAYKQFLRAMGKSSDDVFTDVTIMYPSILELQDEISLTLKSSEFRLSPSVFAFLLADGLFLFFDTAEDENDPKVYRYIETEAKPTEIADTFTEWLTDFVDDSVKIQLELEQS